MGGFVREVERCRLEPVPGCAVARCRTHDRLAPRNHDSCFEVRPWLCLWCGSVKWRERERHGETGLCLDRLPGVDGHEPQAL